MLNVAKQVYLTVKGRPTPTQPATARTVQGHTDVVSAVAFFKDGQRVVTGSWDCTLRIWDVHKGVSIGRAFLGHKDTVRSVAVSPDDRRIASGGVDNTIIIWNVESRQKVFDPLVKHTRTVWSVCFSPDGKRLASGSNDSTVVVWDTETGAVISTLEGHSDFVLSVAFSPDSLKLASGSDDHTIRVWRVSNAELLLEINAHEDRVRSVVWSHDGQQLVSSSYDKEVKFWDVFNGDQISHPCTGHTHHIYSLAISSDGSFIATASDDNTVRLWSTKTHRQIGQALQHTAGVRCIAISPNGELLVSGDEKGKIRSQSIKDILEQGKVEEWLTEVDETHRQQLLSRSNTQLCGHNHNYEPTGDNDITSSHFSENHEVSGGDDRFSLILFGILAMNMTVRNAFITGDLNAAEFLLTQEIDANGANCDSYANRSIVRARNSEWDNALQDAIKSIAIQPSLLGYICKGIALCGNEQLWDAMEAFDLAFIFSNRDPTTIDLLLLIKAVALFNASRHDEAMRRVQDLSTACQHSDTLLCSVVSSYLCVQLAITAFEDGRYNEAADVLNRIIPSITNLFSGRTLSLCEPKCKIFTVLFGWDLDSLWSIANQRRCNACLCAGRVIEAVESHHYMMNMIDKDSKDSYLKWSTAFKKNCIVLCLAKGDEAVAASKYETAVELYSAGIGLDSSCESLFARRSKANLGRKFYAEALHDADKVVELNASSYLGYELKHVMLHNAQRYGEAIEAFQTMLLKLDNAPVTDIRELRPQYVSPSDVEDAIRSATLAQLADAPLRLINTSTGRLCDREEQINSFMESPEYTKILSASMTQAPIQKAPIKDAVAKYFSWVMLSHRWERKEPLLQDVQDKIVYDLDPVGTMVKLQTLCKIARDAGHPWAWSDTCCIDQLNNVELQRSVNSMFVWYRRSSLTVVYLSDVPPSAKSGALANSVWNTRGWTVQEFLAPSVVLFYQNDWTLYLNDHSPNHKESITIMKELEDSTGINRQALVAFRPGMTGAREKLRWASSRVTTVQEDIAYALFGIFGVHLPVIYGEMKQNALGRLLQEIVAQSGDITTLDWVGKSSEFNSCLPADISSYKPLPFTPPTLSEDQIQTLISSLRNAAIVELASTLYTQLDNLSAPRFANRRLQLPCIAFTVTEVGRRPCQGQETRFTYEVKADGLQDLLIITEDRLTRFSPARPTLQTFLLIRPWNRHDFGLPDFADVRSMDDGPEAGSPSDESLGGYHGENVLIDPEAHWTRELRLVVCLGQPFSALLLAQQRGGEYKRIASDHNIIAHVEDTAAVHDMDIRTLEIL